MRLVVGADVIQIESLGQLVIDLHGAELPLAADHVADDEVDLRAVERGLAGLEAERNAERLGGYTHAASALSHFSAAPTYFLLSGSRRPTRTRKSVIFKVPRMIFTRSRQPSSSAWHLFFGAEQVRIVLGEPAHAGHAAKLTRLFPAIDGAEFRQPNRQIAIAVRIAGVDANVMRAVHRLEQIAVDLAAFMRLLTARRSRSCPSRADQ